MIQFSNVSFQQNGEKRISDFSLTFPEGELTLILGPAGSGKSLLLKMIAGIVEPTHGHVFCDGGDVFSGSAEALKHLRSKVSYIFRSGGLISNLTVKENLLLPLNFHFPEVSDEIKHEIVYKQLNEFGIASVKEKRPADISRSICKLVGLIRAIIIEPKVMLYDEPFYDCDTKSQLLILHEIERCKKNKLTQIVMSQSAENLVNYADWVMVFEDGKVHEMSRRTAIFNSKNTLTQFCLQA